MAEASSAEGFRTELRNWLEANCPAEMRDGGMTVEPANDVMMGELRAIGETMTAEWFEAAGDEGRAIVEAYRAMQ